MPVPPDPGADVQRCLVARRAAWEWRSAWMDFFLLQLHTIVDRDHAGTAGAWHRTSAVGLDQRIVIHFVRQLEQVETNIVLFLRIGDGGVPACVTADLYRIGRGGIALRHVSRTTANLPVRHDVV